MNFKFSDDPSKSFDDRFDKHFDDVCEQQKRAFQLAKVGVVVTGCFMLAGGCFMGWLLYTLVTGLTQ